MNNVAVDVCKARKKQTQNMEKGTMQINIVELNLILNWLFFLSCLVSVIKLGCAGNISSFFKMYPCLATLPAKKKNTSIINE